MHVQVTIPVTVTVEYDTTEIESTNGSFLTDDTSKVVKGMILDLSNEEILGSIPYTLEYLTGRLVKKVTVHMDAQNRCVVER